MCIYLFDECESEAHLWRKMVISFAAAILLPVTKPKVKLFSYRETEGDPTSITARNLLSWKITSRKTSSNRGTGNGSSSSSSSICFSSKTENQTQTTETHVKKTPKKVSNNSFLSQGRDEDEKQGIICPGCGVFMQTDDPNLPGFFQEPKVPDIPITDTEETFDDVLMEDFEEIEDGFESSTLETSDDDEEEEGDLDLDWDSDWDDELEDEKIDDKLKKEMDAFAPAGVGYGNVTEETLKRGKKERISKSERKKRKREAVRDVEEVTVCARCHSLRNYGQVKNEKVENLIPDFDFDRLISTRLMKATGTSDASVVVMVVDCVDFDGSFPKRASKSLFKALEGTKKDFKRKLPTLVLVATKVDLLPSQVSPTRLDKWVRHRARANGAPRLSGVYLVSAHKDLGVRNLLLGIKQFAGPRGNVWVIGAQNAGKSTLINAFSKKEGKKPTKLTEAAVPGTTLGILRIGGVLPAKAKMFDTPGLLHPYLMSLRLNRDEQKMIEIRKELRPRSYRIKAGQTVYVGGLMRLDLNQASVETIYVTVFASANISLHLGKTENADETWRKHVGTRLQPPVSEDRVPDLEQLQKSEFKISGISWDLNSTDIAVAGLGWISLGLKGQANVTLWSYEGVEVTLRDPLVLDRARFLERPGFLLPKAISEALGEQSKLEAQKKKKLEEAEEMLV